MNESNMPRGLRSFITFLAFTFGIGIMLYGLYLIVDAYQNNTSFIEALQITALGLVLTFLADQSILNQKKFDMMRDIQDKANAELNKKKGNLGLSTLLDDITSSFGNNTNITVVKQDLGDDFLKKSLSGDTFHFNDLFPHTNKPKQKLSLKEQNEVKNLMSRTELSENDAMIFIKLKDKEVEYLEKYMAQLTEKENYTFAAFLRDYIKDKKNDN